MESRPGELRKQQELQQRDPQQELQQNRRETNSRRYHGTIQPNGNNPPIDHLCVNPATRHTHLDGLHPPTPKILFASSTAPPAARTRTRRLSHRQPFPVLIPMPRTRSDIPGRWLSTRRRSSSLQPPCPSEPLRCHLAHRRSPPDLGLFRSRPRPPLVLSGWANCRDRGLAIFSFCIRYRCKRLWHTERDPEKEGGKGQRDTAVRAVLFGFLLPMSPLLCVFEKRRLKDTDAAR